MRGARKSLHQHDHKTKCRFKSHGRRGGPRKHSERMADMNYVLSMQLQNSSKARTQMKSEVQQVKADAKMAEVPEETSTSTTTKLNVALNPVEEEEDQVDTSRKTLSNNDEIVLDSSF